MASLYIQEYADLPLHNGQVVLVGNEPAVASQKVTATGTSAQSDAFNAKTKFVRLHADAVCSVEFGANPTATSGSARLAIGASEFFGVKGGQKVAVITNS